MTRIQAKADGTILLGGAVSCDGFAYGRAVRVQTHIHYDHMSGFNTSKANQHIVMSEQTRALLFAIQNADLPRRTNISALRPGESFSANGDTVELVPSNHMLGSVQVRVRQSDGSTVGYSSDFFWPVDEVIQVDELVVDSTYGDPSNIRIYTQAQVDEVLVENIATRLRANRPTAIIGYNGRLQHALHLLTGVVRCPVICSPRCQPLVGVYREHGYAMPDTIASDLAEGIELLRARATCIACVTLPERRHLPWVDRFCKVSLSAHMVSQRTPLTDYGNGDCCIAFTDHADFEGTLRYIEATGAQRVWTDPRTGNAEALAESVREQLGIECQPLEPIQSLGWG